MHKRSSCVSVSAVLLLAACGNSRSNAHAATQRVKLELLAEGLGRITDVEFVPDREGFAVVTNQDGKAALVRITQGKVAEPEATVLELDVDSRGEMGLLSLAFHPEYPTNGRLFVHYNPKSSHVTRIIEFALAPSDLGREDAKEVRMLLEVPQPSYNNHKGGELAFGPDGMLYLGLGDGGSAGDPHDNGQNRRSLLGKILRLDVDSAELVPGDNPFAKDPDTRPEIYAYGLRNPWKFSFLDDGRLIVADVGQDKYEEIDVLRAGDNLGWRLKEGFHCFSPSEGCERPELGDPVFEYGHGQGKSVTGGYLYKGSRVPLLEGRYVFGDYTSGRLWALQVPKAAGKRGSATVLGDFGINPTTFARDARGELYVGDYPTGRLYRITAIPKPD